MKKFSKVLSVVLSLTLCASMVAPAFAEEEPAPQGDQPTVNEPAPDNNTPGSTTPATGDDASTPPAQNAPAANPASTEGTSGEPAPKAGSPVATVGDKEYDSFEEAVAAANANGGTLTLLKDVETDKIIEITGNVTINGNGCTITSSANRILWVDSSNVEVNLNSINFESTTAERGVQVNVGKTGVKLNIDGCMIPATYYAINMCNYTDVELSISNSTVSGWGALNLWGDTYNVNVSNSKLIGHNDKPYNEDGWNGFGTIVLEGDTTGKTEDHVNGCNVVLDNCVIVASSETGNEQRPILFNSQSQNNNVIIQGNSTIVDYSEGVGGLCTDDGTNNTVEISGGTFTGDVNESYLTGEVTSLAVSDENGKEVYQVGTLNTITSGDGTTLWTNTGDNSTSLGLTIQLNNKDVSGAKVSWSVAEGSEDIVSVENGLVTAKSNGTATIIATLPNGKTVEYTITVSTYYAPVYYEPVDPTPSEVEIEDPDTPLAELPEGMAPAEPEEMLTRGKLVSILHWMDGAVAAELSSFIDVAAESDLAVAIGWAQVNGITKGVSETEFAPQQNVTIGQLVTFLNRYAAYVGSDVTVELDGDVGEVLTWAQAEEIINAFFVRLTETADEAA